MHNHITRIERAWPPRALMTGLAEAVSGTLARIDHRFWFALSMVASLALVAATRTATGDLFGRYTDHLHHTRAAWTFFHVGWEIYTRPFGEVGSEVFYPQGGLFWPKWPVPYPPGVFIGFLPVALVGRFIPMSGPLYGKVIVVYLLMMTYAALWVFDRLLRRSDAPFGAFAITMVGVFCVRMAHCGFYEGIWLLPGALGIVALKSGRAAAALAWFTCSALLSYRGVTFLPVAVVALVRLFAGEYPLRKRLGLLALCAISCIFIVLAFWTFNAHTPQDPMLRRGVDSPLLQFTTRTYVVMLCGAGAAGFLARSDGLLVGASAAVAALVSILHGGHYWHGSVCIPVLLTLASRRSPTARGTFVALLLVALLWQLAFKYSPFQFLEELIRFIDNGGAIP